MTGEPLHSLRAEGLECIRNDMVLFSKLKVSICSGDLLQVDGSNGSGKTSLLRILCGLAMPNEGTVYWNDQDICDLEHEFLANVSYVGHQNGIKKELSPVENLTIVKRLTLSRNNISPEQALNQFGLSGYKDTPVRKLSSGQRRRTALSRLLLTNTRLWLLDEPFTSVDEEGKRIIRQILQTHLDSGGMLIISTHEPLQLTNHPLNKIQLANETGAN